MNLKVLIGQWKWKEKRKRKILKKSDRCLRNPRARNRPTYTLCETQKEEQEGWGRENIKETMGGKFSHLMNT